MPRKTWRATKTLLDLRQELVRIVQTGESIQRSKTVLEARIATHAGAKMRAPGLIKRIDAILALRGKNPATKKTTKTVTRSAALRPIERATIDEELLAKLRNTADTPGQFTFLGASECTELLRAITGK